MLENIIFGLVISEIILNDGLINCWAEAGDRLSLAPRGQGDCWPEAELTSPAPYLFKCGGIRK